MMARLEARAARVAQDHAERAKARIAEMAAPGIKASVTRDGVVLEGRRLARRSVADPALRWIGGWLR